MKLLWLQGASCSGCSMNFLCAKRPNLIELQERYGIQFIFHPSIAPLSGKKVQELLSVYTQESIDILVVEGGVITGPDNTGGYHRYAGKPFMKWVTQLSLHAKYIIAVGSCSAFGGIPVLSPNVNDTKGLQFTMRLPGGFLGEPFKSRSGFPVINIPGCPAHWMNVMTILMDISTGKLMLTDLDEYNRPGYIFKDYLHHGCPRNEYFEYRQEATHVGEPGCMFENLGCHGPLVKCNANIHRWFDGWGSCTWAGFPCIGCVSPGFPEESFPMFQTAKLAGIPVNLPEGVKKSAYFQNKILADRACPDRLKIKKGKRHE